MHESNSVTRNTMPFYLPDAICVEHVELSYTLELFHIFFWDLCQLKEPQLLLILDQGSSLDVSQCLFCHLHDKLVT